MTVQQLILQPCPVGSEILTRHIFHQLLRAWKGLKVLIGKIVKSYSHINYVCQIYGPLEVEVSPNPSDYAFGHFVRVAVRSRLLSMNLILSLRLQGCNEGTYVVMALIRIDRQCPKDRS